MIIVDMETFVQNMRLNPKTFPTRKAQAEHIISSYGNTNRADIVFVILDNKPLDIKHYKKLLFQSLVT